MELFPSKKIEFLLACFNIVRATEIKLVRMINIRSGKYMQHFWYLKFYRLKLQNINT